MRKKLIVAVMLVLNVAVIVSVLAVIVAKTVSRKGVEEYVYECLDNEYTYSIDSYRERNTNELRTIGLRRKCKSLRR